MMPLSIVWYFVSKPKDTQTYSCSGWHTRVSLGFDSLGEYTQGCWNGIGVRETIMNNMFLRRSPSPEYTHSGDYRSIAAGGSACGPSLRLTVARVRFL